MFTIVASAISVDLSGYFHAGLTTPDKINYLEHWNYQPTQLNISFKKLIVTCWLYDGCGNQWLWSFCNKLTDCQGHILIVNFLF